MEMKQLDYSRRRFIGAAAVVGAGLSLASCMTTPRKLVTAPPPAAAPEPVALPAPPRVAATLLDEAKAALDAHASMIVHRDRIALADFSLPSSQPRFHLVDLAAGRIERSFLVAHGRGSDPARTGKLQLFSNQPGSNATSRGAYVTAGTYVGKHGRSQRLLGLDPENDRALERAIVIHGADYVDPAMIAAQGLIGRSQGCFAVEPRVVAEVMALLGEGRMIYAGKRA